MLVTGRGAVRVPGPFGNSSGVGSNPAPLTGVCAVTRPVTAPRSMQPAGTIQPRRLIQPIRFINDFTGLAWWIGAVSDQVRRVGHARC